MRFARMSALSVLALSALSMPALAAGKVSVKGTVNDAEGHPVRGAEVSLLHAEKGGKYKEVDSDTTDKGGAFEIADVEDGTYVIVAKKGELRDRSEITVHDGKTPAALSFNVRAGREVAEEKAAEKSTKKKGYVNFVGTVVDKDGKAVKGATVRLLTGDDDKDTDKLKEVETIESEAKGRFEFYKVVFGHYVIDVKKGNLHVHRPVTLKDTDGTQSMEIVLK